MCGEALAQGAQGSCECPIPEGIKDQVGWGPGQPDLVGGSPNHSRVDGIGWVWKFLPTKPFYNSVICFYEPAMYHHNNNNKKLSASWAALPAGRERWSFPSAQPRWDTFGVLCPVLGSPVQETPTGKSLAKGQEGVWGTGEPDGRREAKRAGSVQPGTRSLRGFLLTNINTWWNGVGKRVPNSSWKCTVTEI